MLRSGTSLLQALLTSHPQLFVAYQPFHQLYVDVKQRFMLHQNIERSLPLGDGTDGPPDEAERFRDWLKEKEFRGEVVERLIRRSVTGKGGSCAELADTLPLVEGRFATMQEALHDYLAQRYGKANATWHGSKEILCEEYLPYLLNEGRRCLLIVRDPRAVVASANCGSYREMVGDCYPILMLSRIWRKSVAYALAFGDVESLQVVRYEDLVQSPARTLETIAEFLYLDSSDLVKSMARIRDHAGRPWFGNSSFGEKNDVDAHSIDAWRDRLPQATIELIESLCYPEMLAMDYRSPLHASDCARIIATAGEDTRHTRVNYLERYALRDSERQRELSRLGELLENEDAVQTHGLLPFPIAREKLRQVLRTRDR